MGPRRALSFALAVVFVCGAACASDDIALEIDSTFSEEERSDIVRAADAWNAFTQRPLIRVMPRGEEGDWIVLPAEVPYGCCGFKQERFRTIRLSPSTAPEHVFALALHELGHALGLEHVPHGVMQAVDPREAFTNDDRMECLRAGACAGSLVSTPAR